eukprot:gene20003-26716_t
MRFKASFTDRGKHILEKGFLPTFEKFGKTVQLLLGPEDVHLVQTSLNTDGSFVTCRFAVDVLFDPTTYRIQSKHKSLIALNLDVQLLLRVLRGACANNSEWLDVKLAQRSVPAPGGAEGETVSKPFLSFQGRGQSMSMVQDLPVSRPYPADEIDRLVANKEASTLCPFYLDLSPCAQTLHAMVDRMKSLGDTLMMATCKNGDLHLHVAAINALLGTQLRDLAVFPTEMAEQNSINRHLPAEQQLKEALDSGKASAAYLQLKHLSRVLTVGQLTQPSQMLCGISDTGSHLHIMYVFRNPTDETYDDSVHLSFRLPLKDES